MGFEKEREGKTESLVVYQVVGSSHQCLPTLRLGTGGRPCPKAPGVSLDPARLGQSLGMLPTEVGWMVWPGSFFIEGVVLLHKASQSVSLTVTVMNSNKMSKKWCLDGAGCELNHLRREKHEYVVVAEPLTQPGLLVSWDF